MLNPDRQARVTGSHWISPINFEDEVTRGFAFPEPLRMMDSTLRKAYFTAGATTTDAGFLRIAEALGALGVRDEALNVNWAGSTRPTRQDLDLVRLIAARDFGFTLNVYADALLGDGAVPPPVPMREAVDVLLEAGARVLAPGILEAPTAAAQQRQKDDLADYFAYTSSLGVPTTITLANVGRRDFALMVEMARHAIALGAMRLDLMDSSSSISTDAMPLFVRRFLDGIGHAVPITMHMHNEFGLATAGAIAAATAGASPDVSMNAVSYRAGFAALEEVVLALETFYGVDTGIALERLQGVSDLVARETGVERGAFKALTGPYAYLKHLPADVALAVTTGQDHFPPISHGLVAGRMGQTVTWVWGRFSSDAMVAALAQATGERLDPDRIPLVREIFDAEVSFKTAYPAWLAPAEAEALLHDVLEIDRAGIGAAALADLVDAACPSALLRENLRTATDALAPALAPVAVRRALLALDDDALREALSGLAPGADGLAALTAGEQQALGALPDTQRRILRAVADDYARRFALPLVLDRIADDDLPTAAARRLAAADRAQALQDSRHDLAALVARRLHRALLAHARMEQGASLRPATEPEESL